mmetsp:Transcript_2731/g.3130  ORF Transcript_2731/g.3130 Transcript_2731/m.3130 type:complete len:97 (+) Transcript_2731:1767-2057(+)
MTSVIPITLGSSPRSLVTRRTAKGSDVPLNTPATFWSLVALTESWIRSLIPSMLVMFFTGWYEYDILLSRVFMTREKVCGVFYSQLSKREKHLDQN